MSTAPSCVTTIKNFCRLISGYGITRFEITYDGEGDDGDLHITAHHETPPAIGDVDNKEAQRRYLDFDQMVRHVTEQPNSLVTSAKTDQFYDAIYDLLPMGWEIDSGSFGDVGIEVNTGVIRMTHNERIVDINTEEFTF